MSDHFDPDQLPDDDGFDELAALRAIGRTMPPDEDGWETPPADLWARIEAEALASDAGPDVSDGVPDGRPGAVTVGPEDEQGQAVPAPVVPLSSASRRRRPWLLAAGAAAAAAVLVVSLILVNDGDSDQPEVIASVALDVLAGSGSGRADLVDADGVRQIRLETADLNAGDGFLEVWMIDPTVSRLVSLGPLRPDGIYDLPDGVDPAEFPIVDISVEPVDGDPTHSGNSLLRGQLTI